MIRTPAGAFMYRPVPWGLLAIRLGFRTPTVTRGSHWQNLMLYASQLTSLDFSLAPARGKIVRIKWRFFRR